MIDEEHGQMSKPASSLSGLRLILGQFNRTPTHSARRADGRCDACQGAAEGPGLVQFGRRFAISMGSHLSSRPIATCWKPQQLSIHLQKILLVRCLSVLPFSRRPATPAFRAKVARSAFLMLFDACRCWRASHSVLRFHLQGFY